MLFSIDFLGKVCYTRGRMERISLLNKKEKIKEEMEQEEKKQSALDAVSWISLTVS